MSVVSNVKHTKQTICLDDEDMKKGLDKIFKYRNIPLTSQNLEQVYNVLNLIIKNVLENKEIHTLPHSNIHIKLPHFLFEKRVSIICANKIPEIMIIRDLNKNDEPYNHLNLQKSTATALRLDAISKEIISIEQITYLKSKWEVGNQNTNKILDSLEKNNVYISNLLAHNRRIINTIGCYQFKNKSGLIKTVSLHSYFNSNLISYYRQHLSVCIDQSKKVTITKNIIKQLLEALNYMHHFQIDKNSTGLVYFALDSKNICVECDTNSSFEGIPRLTFRNFKLAQIYKEDECQGKHSFPNNLAPEEFPTEMVFPNGAKKIGPKVDLWASGLILYFLLYGKKPDIERLTKTFLLTIEDSSLWLPQDPPWPDEERFLSELNACKDNCEVVFENPILNSENKSNLIPLLIGCVNMIMEFLYQSQKYQKDKPQLSDKFNENLNIVLNYKNKLSSILKTSIITELCNFSLPNRDEEDPILYELLCKLLVVDPDQRLTASEALAFLKTRDGDLIRDQAL